MTQLNRRLIVAMAVFLLVAGLVGASATTTLLSSGTDVSNNDDGIVLSAGNGPSINVTGDLTVYNNTGGPDQYTVDWYSSSGNVTFSSAGPTNVRIQKSNLTGEWTRVEALNVTQHELMINPEDKPAINVSGDTDRIEFRNPTLDDGNADFVYAGASGETTVTVRSLANDQPVRAVDMDTGDVLDTATTDESGTVTFAGMPNSDHTVEIVSGDADPILDDPRPDGNVSEQPDEFSVDVTDDDFPGDNVSVEFYYEGSQIDTVYTESDGRVSTSNVPDISPGVHDWSVVATDENGNRDILNNTVGIPGTLHIRNETNASQLVDDPVEVTVSFENGSTVETRTTTDGTINMTGLPTTDFVVSINASDDYYGRTVYFQSIIGDTSVYLLNTSYSAVETRFTLDDPTGQFPTESVVYVRRAINRSGENVYRVIHSDRFGTEGVTVDLQQDKRYQISVRNPSGDIQQVGPYRADVSETVTIRPGAPEIGLGDYTEGWSSNATLNNRTLEVRYSDPEQETQSVTVFIHERGNRSNRLRPNSTYYDLGNFSAVYDLNENESQKTWVVRLDVERAGGELSLAHEVSNNPDLTPNLSREWRLIIGIGMMLISAGVFSILNAGIGGVIVSIEGGVLWYLGWLGGATTGVAVVICLFVALLAHLYASGRA